MYTRIRQRIRQCGISPETDVDAISSTYQKFPDRPPSCNHTEVDPTRLWTLNLV